MGVRLVVKHLAVHGHDRAVGAGHAAGDDASLHGRAHVGFPEARLGRRHAGEMRVRRGLGGLPQLGDRVLVVHQPLRNHGLCQLQVGALHVAAAAGLQVPVELLGQPYRRLQVLSRQRGGPRRNAELVHVAYLDTQRLAQARERRRGTGPHRLGGIRLRRVQHAAVGSQQQSRALEVGPDQVQEVALGAKRVAVVGKVARAREAGCEQGGAVKSGSEPLSARAKGFGGTLCRPHGKFSGAIRGYRSLVYIKSWTAGQFHPSLVVRQS